MAKITVSQLKALNELKITPSSSKDKITPSEVREVIDAVIDSYRHKDDSLEVGVDDIDATGTPSNLTFLRGDGVWSTTTGSSGLTQEQVEDLLSVFLVDGNGIDTTYDDVNGSLTIALDAANLAKLNYITLTSSINLDALKVDVASNTNKNTYPSADAAKVANLPADQNSVNTTNQAALDLKLAIADINDTLISTSTVQPLSANQGKVLKDALDALNTLLSSDDIALDELQEVVDYIKLNRADLDALNIAAIAGLQTALDNLQSDIDGISLADVMGNGNIASADITMNAFDITNVGGVEADTYGPNVGNNVSLVPNGAGYVTVNSSQIKEVDDPTDPQDAMTLAYFNANLGAGTDDQTLAEVLASGNSTGGTDIDIAGAKMLGKIWQQQEAVPNHFTINEYSTKVEGAEGYLQFVAAYTGVYAGGIGITAAPATGDNLNWGMMLGGPTSTAPGALSFRYTTTNADGSITQFNDDEKLTILTDGKVGIGKVDPSTLLDVNGVINLNANKITGVADPTLAQDAATKAYVDANLGGSGEFSSVSAFTTDNAIVRVDGTGKVIQESVATLSDAGALGALLEANFTSGTGITSKLNYNELTFNRTTGASYVRQIGGESIVLGTDNVSDINTTRMILTGGADETEVRVQSSKFMAAVNTSGFIAGGDKDATFVGDGLTQRNEGGTLGMRISHGAAVDLDFLGSLLNIRHYPTANFTGTSVNIARLYPDKIYAYQPFRPTFRTTTDKNALTPEEGWVLYDSTQDKLNMYTGGAWRSYSPDPEPISFTASRNIASTDIGNIIECTTSATLTITLNFSAMEVKNIINLEAHGAILTIDCPTGVTINGQDAASINVGNGSEWTGGVLRKVSTNGYFLGH